MDKEFIPYEQALQLKELGFDEPCFGWFRTIDFKEYFLETELDLEEEFTDLINSNFTEGACSALLYQQAFTWFREKYGYYPLIEMSEQFKKWLSRICNIDGSTYAIGVHATYEKAELECLNKLIEIVKNK